MLWCLWVCGVVYVFNQCSIVCSLPWKLLSWCIWCFTSRIITDLCYYYTIDNHDTQRGDAPLTYKDGDVYRFANVFMLAYP